MRTVPILGKLPLAPFAINISETVGADNDTGVNLDAIPELRSRVQSYPWMQIRQFSPTRAPRGPESRTAPICVAGTDLLLSSSMHCVGTDRDIRARVSRLAAQWQWDEWLRAARLGVRSHAAALANASFGLAVSTIVFSG